jgi:hypothetical protein
MALGPISPVPVQPQTTPARDVGAAQRAFFQAALAQVQGAPAPAPPLPAPAPARGAPVAQAQADAPQESSRTYRPGKLLDITV